MPKAKIIRLELPKAKLLKFNRNGKSVPAPAQQDEIAETLSMVRQNCSDAEWTMLRTNLEKARDYHTAAIEQLHQMLERAECNGGTASWQQ
jgi:transcriptional regulator